MGLIKGLAKLTGKAVAGAGKKIAKSAAVHAVTGIVVSGKLNRAVKKVTEKASSTLDSISDKIIPSTEITTHDEKTLKEFKAKTAHLKERKITDTKKPVCKKRFELKISSPELYLMDHKENKKVTFLVKERKSEKSYIGYLDKEEIAEIEVGTQLSMLKHHLPQNRRNNDRTIYINDEEFGTLERELSRKDRWTLTPKIANCTINEYDIVYDACAGEVKIQKKSKKMLFKTVDSDSILFHFDVPNFNNALLYSLMIIAAIDSLRIDTWNVNSSHVCYNPF